MLALSFTQALSDALEMLVLLVRKAEAGYSCIYKNKEVDTKRVLIFNSMGTYVYSQCYPQLLNHDPCELRNGSVSDMDWLSLCEVLPLSDHFLRHF